MNTLCLQRQVSLTGIKGHSSWQLSDQFAQSVTSNKSSPQNLTLLGSKCGITPRGRNEAVERFRFTVSNTET